MSTSISRRRGAVTALLAVVCTAAAGCAPGGSTAAPAGQAQASRVPGAPHPSLVMALRSSRDLGPIAPTRQLTVSLGLLGRNQVALNALVASGRRVTPAQYAAVFGPDPLAVAAARSRVTAAGLTSQWQPGDTVMSVSGPASAVEALLAVGVRNHVAADGTRFYAPTAAVQVPAALRPTVTSVAGLDNYPGRSTQDLRDPKGLSPKDASDFYNVTPLYNAGLKGAGQTVYLVEGDEFGPDGVAAYAKKFGLPPFDITVKRDSANWGDPQAEGNGPSETDLDVEIIHAIAPDAKIVIYAASLKGDNIDKAMRAVLRDHPGSILSISIGQCESTDLQQTANQDASATTAAAATGSSIFISSGDRGAYGCVGSGDNAALSPNYLASQPSVTSVGGTTVFLSATGGYGSEAAWGEPAQQWGSGGGNSMLFKAPTWQTGPGVSNQYSNGTRQQPDVSAEADGLSGWDVFGNGGEGTVGGTSAAAPFWAAITALIDQNLAQQKLATVGFANPALYQFAQGPAGLPNNPFHDITRGNDLYYPATPGWDFATGLGTPDVAALADDFEWYAKNVAPHG